MKVQSLKEFGSQLPVLPPKFTSREFAFRPWTMKEEKDLTRMRSGTKRTGVFVREIMSRMLTHLNGKPWAETNPAERDVILNQMPYGNVLYLYMWLRFEAMGPDFRVANIDCPACGTNIPEFVGDLNTLEVETKEMDEPEEALYDMLKPFKFGDAMVTGLYCRYTPWDVMEKVTVAQAENGDVKESFIHSSVVAAKTDVQERAALNPVALTSGLSKREIENLYAFITENNGGPIMSVDVKCPDCTTDFHKALNWNYDYFFGSSSLPRRTRGTGRSSSSSATTSLA